MLSSILTITAPASSARLTTVATARTRMELVDKSKDELLGDYIDQASAAVVRHCNRGAFGRETLSEAFRFGGADLNRYAHHHRPSVIQLTRYPVASIASVTEDSDAPLTAVDYEADLRAGQLFRLDGNDFRRRWCASRKVVVAYTAGYLLPGEVGRNLPSEIEDATLRLVKAAYFAGNRDPLVKVDETVGVERQEYWVGAVGENGALPPDVAALLSPYVERLIG